MPGALGDLKAGRQYCVKTYSTSTPESRMPCGLYLRVEMKDLIKMIIRDLYIKHPVKINLLSCYFFLSIALSKFTGENFFLILVSIPVWPES